MFCKTPYSRHSTSNVRLYAVALPVFLLFVLLTTTRAASGNAAIERFVEARRQLARIHADHRETLYCGAAYDARGRVILPAGFTAGAYARRARRMEWEHVVPAENFGRTFAEWREGHRLCIRRGKPFRGRRCAERASREYRRMQADMHNLYPAIGAVNALRRNYSFQPLPGAPPAFGSCPVKLRDRRVEPPPRARGAIARAYLYMQAAYPRYRMGRRQEQLMRVWDAAYPPTGWECARNRRILQAQGNANPYIERRCR